MRIFKKQKIKKTEQKQEDLYRKIKFANCQNKKRNLEEIFQALILLLSILKMDRTISSKMIAYYTNDFITILLKY